MSTNTKNVIVEVKDLVTSFNTEEGKVHAVNGVSFDIREDEILGLVGESGCGKSVTSLSIMGLLPCPPGQIESGQILYKGKDLLQLPEKSMQKMRGKDFSMIFQEPMTALNPVAKIGTQISEVLEVHTNLNKKERWAKAVEMMKLVGIPEAEKRADSFPHEMSGGMRQRIIIAMALINDPSLLIADEPTTALDVTIQAQIMDLIQKLGREFHSAVLLITHDLAVIAENADRVIVMYAGRVVEQAQVNELFKNAKHPYTQGLLKSIPVLGDPDKKLESIKGSVPSLINLPKGCPFLNRCPHAFELCDQSMPDKTQITEDHYVRCHLYTREEQ
ncbi:ABC transporter ATP-binding protein [Spirochaeta cellobiosiphila]|uniref:ABC transporter ATP-binding protein n=1 Tax=Spirochaeta cellobiosiphila TaxID=504483 RepID=UPI00040F1C40|nr:ABC transporter ATP-binding protein [Spirochaeta cellobiosiphila]